MAEWNEEPAVAWGKAVREVKIMVDEMLHDGQLPGITSLDIEMIATQLAWLTYMDAIQDEPQLASQWPDIAQNIYQILQSHQSSRDCLRSIYICRLGYLCGYHEQNTITIYIAVDYAFAGDQ